MSVAETAESPNSRLSVIWPPTRTFALGICVQPVPSQCSISVWDLLKLVVVPAAQTSVGDSAASALFARSLPPPPGLGLATVLKVELQAGGTRGATFGIV